MATALRVLPRSVSARNEFLAQAHASCDSRLRRFFAKRGIARDEICDLTQEVYLRLMRQTDLSSIRSAQAFLYTTAMNLLRDRFRRRASRGVESSVEGDQVDAPAEGVDPQRAAECDQQLRQAWAIVASLKPATRQVFMGHRVDGYSYAELARELGVSVSMIEKHMIRAIGALAPLR